MTFKKKLLISTLTLMPVCALAIGYFAYSKKQENAINYSSYVSGLEQGDIIRVEAVKDGKYQFLNEDMVVNFKDTYELTSVDSLNNAQRYNLLVTLQEDINAKPTDVSFLVDKNTGYIKASINGIDKDADLKFAVNGKESLHKANYTKDGQAYFRTVTLNTKKKQNICLDVGGYRGSNLTICHTVKDSPIQEAALSLPSFSFTMPTFALPGFQTFSSDIEANWTAGLRSMTAQINTVQKQETAKRGRMLDAKEEKEMTRDVQKARAEAQTDFQPSQRACKTVSQSRGLKSTREHTKLVQTALVDKVRARALGAGENVAYLGPQSDTQSRLYEIRTAYANPRSNHLDEFAVGGDKELVDMDVNFYNTVMRRKTIPADFESNGSDKNKRAVFALMDNLFYPQAAAYIPPSVVQTPAILQLHQQNRELQVAREVFVVPAAGLISQKISGPRNNPAKENVKAGLEEQGYSDAEIAEDEVMGENPSLYAQQSYLEDQKYLDAGYHIEGSGEGAPQAQRNQSMQAADSLKRQMQQKNDMNNVLFMQAAQLGFRLREYQSQLDAEFTRISDLD